MKQRNGLRLFEQDADKTLGRAVAQWLRHYAASRNVPGLRPNGMIIFFNVLNPSGRSRPWGLLSL
jgi:hypothetical protein